MTKVLIVEDESPIRRFIAINLKRNGFDICEAECGKKALNLLSAENPEVVVLDIMLPDMNGYEVCTRIREVNSEVAVIMLTARSQDMDKIMGLELGADDYIIKPFNPLELVARIRAILRRIESKSEETIKSRNSVFRIDETAQRVYKKDELIVLTPREFSLIKVLISNPGRAIKRNEILDLAWGMDFIGDVKTLDVHIRRLREKIEDDPSNPAFIETVWGYGYRWQEGQ